MPDIRIKKGYRECHIICAESAVGKKWLIDNIKSIVTEAGGTEIPIASEYAEEIASKIREDGIDVDVE